MKKFIIRDRESGNFIDEFDTIEEAQKELQDMNLKISKKGLIQKTFTK